MRITHSVTRRRRQLVSRVKESLRPTLFEQRADLSALTADAARELDVLRHDRHALGVDRAEVGV